MKNPGIVGASAGVQGDNVGPILPHCHRSATWDHKGDNVNEFPDWAGRAVLAEALKACGLPVSYGAMWRRPRDTMSENQLREALEVYGQVLAQARLILPAGVSGAVLGQEWRDAAWRCTVAGLALLDFQARERLVGRRDEEHELPPVQAEPVVIRQRAAEAPVVMPAAQATFTIRRRGEVARAS